MPALVAGTHAVVRYLGSGKGTFYGLEQHRGVTAWIPATSAGMTERLRRYNIGSGFPLRASLGE